MAWTVHMEHCYYNSNCRVHTVQITKEKPSANICKLNVLIWLMNSRSVSQFRSYRLQAKLDFGFGTCRSFKSAFRSWTNLPDDPWLRVWVWVIHCRQVLELVNRKKLLNNLASQNYKNPKFTVFTHARHVPLCVVAKGQMVYNREFIPHRIDSYYYYHHLGMCDLQYFFILLVKR